MPEITTEIFHSDAWHDISADVYNRDVVTITRGRPDETSQVKAGRMTLTINNRAGRYSPRNPRSDLFGLIGRNTPIRVSVAGDIRFTGEVPAWPQQWDKSSNDIWVPIQAAGILRRLGQGASPLDSAILRSVVSSPNAHVYWPMDEQVGSTQLFSPLEGVPPATLSGEVELAAFESVPGIRGSGPLPILRPRQNLVDLSGITATIPPFPILDDNIGWFIQAFMFFTDPGPVPSGQSRNLMQVSSTGSIARWTINIDDANEVGIIAQDQDGVFVYSAGLAITAPIFQRPLRVGLRIVLDAELDVRYDLTIQDLDTGAAVSNFTDDVMVGGDIGRPSSVEVSIVDAGPPDERAYGQLIVGSDTEFELLSAQPLDGYFGETAADRITRLCNEEDVAVQIIGSSAKSAAMGVQQSATFLDLLREAAIADQGILYEPRDVLGLHYRTRTDLYNQAPALELDYTERAFSSVPEPVDDDRATRNDITVTRQRGSSARLQQAFGALSVQPPPAGVGRYDENLTVNLAGDGQLSNDVSWRLSLGTVDEPRFPSLVLALHSGVFAEPTPPALDLGDRVTIANMPDWVSHNLVSQMAQGFTERLSNTLWFIEINASPESPYRVGVYAEDNTVVPVDALSRYSSAGTVTTAPFVAGTDTALAIGTLIRPYWTTDAANMPFDILVAGVRLRVTAISAPTGDFQTMTVQQAPINGIIKTIPAASVVALFQPAVYAL